MSHSRVQTMREMARPVLGASKAMLALVKELPKTPDQNITLANPRVPAGYTNKFERMSPNEYESSMKEICDVTQDENKK